MLLPPLLLSLLLSAAFSAFIASVLAAAIHNAKIYGYFQYGVVKLKYTFIEDDKVAQPCLTSLLPLTALTHISSSHLQQMLLCCQMVYKAHSTALILSVASIKIVLRQMRLDWPLGFRKT